MANEYGTLLDIEKAGNLNPVQKTRLGELRSQGAVADYGQGADSRGGEFTGGLDQYINAALGKFQQAVQPSVKAYEAAIPEIENRYKTQIAQREAEKQPLIDRYQNLIGELKGSQTKSENRQSLATRNELGRRGITSDSGLYEQEVVNALNPITSEYASKIKDVGLSQETDLRTLANNITNLVLSQGQEQLGVRKAIADLLSGAGQNAITAGAGAFQSAQSQALQRQQLEEQARANRENEAIARITATKPSASSGGIDANTLAVLLGNQNKPAQKGWVSDKGQLWTDTKKYPIGADPKTGQTIYSDGSKGWTKWY